MTTEGQVLNLYVGHSKPAEIGGRSEVTAFVRTGRISSIALDLSGIINNELGTARRLGKINHAVYLFHADHYRSYEDVLKRPVNPGQFAENVTYIGPDEHILRIGDQVRIGTAVVELTIPRIPCYKMAHFFKADAGFPSLFSASGRTGMYARVIQAGEITTDDSLTVIKSDPRNALISELNLVLTGPAPTADLLARVKSSPALFDALRLQIDERMTMLGLENEPRARTVKVLECHRECDDVMSVTFRMPCPSGQSPKPGQFVTFGIEDDDGNRHFRCYSLIEAPFAHDPGAGGEDGDDKDPVWRIAVKRQRTDTDKFSVSNWIHDRVGMDTTCFVFPQAGDFTLPDDQSSGISFIAGGIGITPILAHLRELARRRFESPVTLIYATPDSDHIPFWNELLALGKSLPKLKLCLYLTRQQSLPAGTPDNWHTGYPDLVRHISSQGEDNHLFVCGPAPMIEAVRTIHTTLNRLTRHLHFELFASGSPALPPRTGIKQAQITITSTGYQGLWNEEDGSLLNWIERHTELRPPAACRSGLCRTCRADLKRGEVAYPPSVSPPPTSSILLCCAHPASDIEIDFP